MRHLAIVVLLTVACGGKTSAPPPALAPGDPAPEAETEPAPDDGLELTENQILGELMSVTWEDEEAALCVIQLMMPAGNDSFYVADPAICEQDNADLVGTEVVLFETHADPRMVTSITPADALRD